VQFVTADIFTYGATSWWAGVPAKKVKDISPELFEGEVMRIVNNYVKYSEWFKD
jgi:hypothetical protein